MFNTFVGVKSKPDAASSGRRREVVSKACEECRRRKTKCSGVCPCSGCVACHAKCVFPEFRRRRRRLYRAPATGKSEEYETVIRRLFGDSALQPLKGLSRNALLEVIQSRGAEIAMATPPSLSGQSGDGDDKPCEPSRSPATPTESQLHPVQSFDGVGLQYGEDRPCYANPASVAGAVKALEQLLPSPLGEDIFPLSTSPVLLDQSHRHSQPPYHEAQRLIDAYFASIHVVAPVIHEPSFRALFLSRSNSDGSWLALLNMVFALGSIASCRGESEDDLVYYSLARKHLPLESFDNCRLETLHAMILMGGVYLPYRDRGELASALLGASYRVACTLGLHCERTESRQGDTTVAGEIKRRTWWTLYVLDAWASTSLGRPWVAVSAFPDRPRNILDDQHGETPATEATVHSPLIHSIELCRILCVIQEHLRLAPVLTGEEISQYDNMLLSWFHSLPPFLTSREACAPSLQDARVMLQWRYYQGRLLLHQSAVVDMAARPAPLQDASPGDQTFISQCCTLAVEVILTIQAEQQLDRMNRICSATAVGVVFHACVIILIALAVEPMDGDAYQGWVEQVETGILLCNQLSSSSPLGRKLKGFLERLFLGAVTPVSLVVPSPVYPGVPASFHVLGERFADGMEPMPEHACFPGLSESDVSYVADQFGFPA